MCEKYKKENSKRKVGLFVERLTKNKIKHRIAEQWDFENALKNKPLIISDKELPTITSDNNSCMHGYKLFCPACKLYIKQINPSPLPILWKTHDRGKIFVYDEFWKELIDILKNGRKIGILNQHVSSILNLDQRGMRRWSNQNFKPKIYSREEFTFTKPNLYWTGLFFSDGHIRNNGSNLSYTYQVGSSNIFQGYWYPQLIQKLFPILKNKGKNSTTKLSCYKEDWSLKTNISGISPIFMDVLKNKKIISKRKNTKTSGFQKRLPNNFLKDLENKGVLFQGIFDGDGHYSLTEKNSITMSLSLDPSINHNHFISNVPLVPTVCTLPNRKTKVYEKENKLLEVRFAPTSLKNLKSIEGPTKIVDQLEFILDSAQHSIRPDKVHQLTNIIKRITSKNYGEYQNSFPIQREIRDLSKKRQLKEKAKQLVRQYPIKEDKYFPFQPLWAKELCSKKEWFSKAWDFFFNLENLNARDYPSKQKLNFVGGVPVDFKL